MTYLQTRCLHNSELKTSLIKDCADPETKIQLQMLAVLGKMLTGPWMKLFYRSQEKQLHHMDAFDAVKSCYSRMESQQSKKEIVLEEITTDFFENTIDCTIDEKVWLPAADIFQFSEDNGENAYNGEIEKLKGKKYTICYWDLDQTYDDDGEDYKVLLHEMVVDFICGDVEFMLD